MAINENRPNLGGSNNSNPGELRFGLTSKLAAFGNGGETYDKIFQRFQERIAVINGVNKTDEKYHIIKMFKQSFGLNYSAIIVAENKNDITVAHVLLIEKTGDYPAALVENINGIRYDIVRTPADAFDAKYASQTKKLVGDTLGVVADNVLLVDGTLVPDEFDANNENLIQDLFVNTLNSIDCEMAVQLKSYSGINIVNIIKSHPSGKFFVNLFFNNNDSIIYDQTGMPIRQDICISLSFKDSGNGNNKSVNQGNEVVDIVKTHGYIDFDWTGPVNNGNMMGSQKFVPNFIITHIDSPLVPTPDIVILAVASVLSINEDMNWMQAFRPNPGKKNEVDFLDIGGLNVEGNIEGSNTGFGKRIGTKTKDFTMIDFNNIIQSLVRPTLMVSIDVPKAGPETWFTSVFTQSKNNNSRGANERIYNSIRDLTNGTDMIDRNIPVFANISNKFHGGYYKTKDGIRDIRHLSSYLSVANHVVDTGQQPVLISQYTNTLYNNNISIELRAAERKKFIDSMSNNTAIYKQYYDRLTFSSDFVNALLGSLKAIRFEPAFSNMGQSNDMFQRRSTADLTGAMVGQDTRFMGNNNSYGNFFMPNGYNRNF